MSHIQTGRRPRLAITTSKADPLNCHAGGLPAHQSGGVPEHGRGVIGDGHKRSAHAFGAHADATERLSVGESGEEQGENGDNAHARILRDGGLFRQ